MVALALAVVTPQRVRGSVATYLTTTLEFQGPEFTESGVLPPDVNGAVSLTQVMVVVNGRFKLYDKAGNPDTSLNVTDTTFFESVRDGFGTRTPHVRYDRLSGRWFVTEINLAPTSNRILIAVSSGATITGTSSFTFYQFQHDLVGPTPNMDTGHFASDASLGVDANALYIGVNELAALGGAKQNTTGYVINKADLVAGTLTVTAFRGLAVGAGAGPWAPQGVDNDDTGASEGYFIGSDNASLTTLIIRRVSNPGGSPSISSNIGIEIPAINPAVPQTVGGSTWPLDAVDNRLFSAMIKKNKITGVSSLWTAQNSGRGSGNASRWYQIDNLTTTPTLTQSGAISVSVARAGSYFWMPSAAANGRGQLAVGANQVSYVDMAGLGGVTIGVATRLAVEPLGTINIPDYDLAGGSYNVETGGPQRWGAYSLTLVDPADDQTFWTFQEAAAGTKWYTRVIKLVGPPPATVSSASRTTIARGGSGSTDVTITGTTTTTAQAAFFDPGPGYASRIGASVSGGVVVTSVTYIDATHVTLSLSTGGASLGPKDVTIINPDGQQSTKTSLFTVVSTAKPGDFSGDGKSDLGLFDPKTAIWNVPGWSQHQWGGVGDIPVPGDYNGDGRVEFATFRPSTGQWFTDGQTGQPPQWGQPGDIPVPGDYDGDGRTDIAVWRPGNGYWYVRNGVTQEWGQPGDIPVPADYDGDGKTDIATFRPSNGIWYVRGVATQVWGQAGDIPVPADYNGDGKADFSVYRPSATAGGPWWYVKDVGSWPIGIVSDEPLAQDLDGDGQAELVVYRPATGTYYSYYWATNTWQTTVIAARQIPLLLPVSLRKATIGDVDGDHRRDPAIFRPSDGRWWVLKSSGSYLTQQWGALGDVPLAGDYDGDGLMDLAVYRPSDGYFWTLYSATGFTTWQGVPWGISGDIPVAGDFDGDGRTDLTVYRPSNGAWWSVLSSGGYRSWSWGLSTDVPISGDFDGDGRADVTVFRPTDGSWLSSLSTGGSMQVGWGLSGDVPVPGDYDGDGTTDLAVYRPADGMWWLLTASGSRGVQWGLPGDRPVPGDYDGDGKTDLAVYRPADGTWYVRFSSTDFQTSQTWQWGLNTDIPVPAR